MFVSDSERGSNTQRKKLSMEECVKKKRKETNNTGDPNIPISEVTKGS